MSLLPMSSTELVDHLSDSLLKIGYLAEASQRKCTALTKNMSSGNSVECCKKILNLCRAIRQNCEVFEEELTDEALKHNILNKVGADACDSNIPPNDSTGIIQDTDGINISLKFGDILKSEKIQNENCKDVDKFWLDLIKFAENYGSTQQIPVENEEHNTQPSISSDVTDPLLKELREMFGDDSDLERNCEISKDKALHSKGLDPKKSCTTGREEDELEVSAKEAGFLQQKNDTNEKSDIDKISQSKEDSQESNSEISDSLEVGLVKVVDEYYNIQDHASQPEKIESSMSIDDILEAVENAEPRSIEQVKSASEDGENNQESSKVENDASLKNDKQTEPSIFHEQIMEIAASENGENIQESPQIENDANLKGDKPTELPEIMEIAVVSTSQVSENREKNQESLQMESDVNPKAEKQSVPSILHEETSVEIAGESISQDTENTQNKQGHSDVCSNSGEASQSLKEKPTVTEISEASACEGSDDMENTQSHIDSHPQIDEAADASPSPGEMAKASPCEVITNVEVPKDVENSQNHIDPQPNIVEETDTSPGEMAKATPCQVISHVEEREDLEATQTVVLDSEGPCSPSPSEMPNTEKLSKVTEVSDEPKKNEFFSVLGLGKADNYDKTNNIRDELMDVLVEVACREGSDGGFSESDDEDMDTNSSSAKSKSEKYTDKDVEDALKYLEDSDWSEVESLKSCASDILLLSDTDDEHSISDSNLKTTVNGTTLENSIRKNKSSEIDEDEIEVNSSAKISSGEVQKDEPESMVREFVPKICSVNVKRMNLKKIQQKRNSFDRLDEESSEEESSNEKFDKKDFVAKPCYVKLEPLRLLRVSSDSDDSLSSDSSDENEKINRLCDLSTLDKKRRRSIDESGKLKSLDSRRIKRKRVKKNLSGSETTSLSGYSTVSEDELRRQRGGIFDDEEIDSKVDFCTAMDPNELLTEIVCHTIHNSGSDDSSSCSESGELVRRKRKKNVDATKKANKEAKDKDSWRNDPLLTGKLDLPADKVRNEDSGTEKQHKKRKRRDSSDSNCSGTYKKIIRNHKRLDPDWRSDEDTSWSNSSGDDFENVQGINKKNNNDDSDIEFVDASGASPSKNSVINLDSDEDCDRKPGRRNILSVLSNERLTEETQKATKEEEERVMRLEKRIQMRNTQSQADLEDCIILDTASDGYKVTVDPSLSKRMYPHQVEGVKFMWDACYESIDNMSEGTGCILAHNMGLGKTFQVVSLAHTLFCHSVTNTKHVLIVCPLSTVSGWKREFHTGLKIATNNKNINIISLESADDSDTKFGRINKWKTRGGVMIVGYEAFEKLTSPKNTSSKGELQRKALTNPGPELVVCDEGHLLKNGKALRTKALMAIRTKRRIVLTGTPLQNNLTEYYHMVQFVKPNLLGTRHEFNRQFANPIMNGQYEDSDEGDIKLMKKRTHVLHRLLKNTVQRYEATELKQYLQSMKDYAIFIQLHPVQEKLYRSFIEMTKTRTGPKTMRKMTFFTDYQLTKYICSHPQLLYTMETQNTQRKKKTIKETDVISQEPEVQEVEGIPAGWWKSMCPDDVMTDIELGTKLKVMMAIIEEAEKIGEKVLIFTSSLVELSSIEYFLKLKGTPSCPSWRPRKDYFRMDGTVSPSLRTSMCEIFNDKRNKTLRLFLMSHKVGGLGLNLVSANRVILLGANFNPSHDTQSIFRAYRFGQEKPVYIYRLISMGTMEEKIYHRCVTKLAIASRVVDKHQIARHYKNLDLEDLYTVAVDLSLVRSTPAKPDDDLLSNVLLKYDCIHKYHHHEKLLENRPDEDLNEEDKKKAWEEFHQMKKPSENPTGPPTNDTRVSDIMAKRWAQLVQNGPVVNANSKAIPKDPLKLSPEKQFRQIANAPVADHFLASASNFLNSAKPQHSTDQANKHFRPNPTHFTKNSTVLTKNLTVKNNTANAAVISHEILQNVSNNNANSKQKEKNVINNTANSKQKEKPKVKSSAVGPNPLALGSIYNRKENLVTKKGITPIRKTSSDDFQQNYQTYISKFASSVNNKSIAPPRKHPNVGRSNEPTHSKSKPTTSGVQTSKDDDDDIILIESPEKELPHKNLVTRSEKKDLNDVIQNLSKNRVFVSTVPNKKVEKRKTPKGKELSQDDECIIEIL